MSMFPLSCTALRGIAEECYLALFGVGKNPIPVM
jgi:hypothetical protein